MGPLTCAIKASPTAGSAGLFSPGGEDALVPVWDRGTVPQLYSVHAAERSVRLVSALFPFRGSAFADFSGRFEPFYQRENSARHER